MRNICFLLLTFMCISFGTLAQDVITLTNGNQIQAKVLEINPGDVKYKDFNNQDGPTITILKINVSSVVYANGTKTLFNESSSSNEKPTTGHFVKGDGSDRNRSQNGGYKKTPGRGNNAKGWYFGVGLNLGAGYASSSDPSYATTSNTYSSANVLATRMFSQHLGIQFGIGDETYNYGVSDYYGDNDILSQLYFTIPVRALYLSNSKERVGFYATAGFDFSFLAFAKDNENDDISSYYNSVLVSPYVGCGVEFRTRRNNVIWMIGPYYKASVTNCYSGVPGNTNLLPGNTGSLSSAGISLSLMNKFRNRRR